MKKLGKLGDITLLKVEIDFDTQLHTFHGWDCLGTAVYCIGWKKYKCEFEYYSDTDYKIEFARVGMFGNKIPTKELQRQALVVLIYGQIGKFEYMIKQIEYFKK